MSTTAQIQAGYQDPNGLRALAPDPELQHPTYSPEQVLELLTIGSMYVCMYNFKFVRLDSLTHIIETVVQCSSSDSSLLMGRKRGGNAESTAALKPTRVGLAGLRVP